MSELTRKDMLWIDLAVHRVDWTLDARVSRAKRREIRDELRANLVAAAQKVGAREAVRQLGDLDALARSYVEVYRSPWDFRAGTWAMAITYFVLGILSLIIFFAFSAGVSARGGHPASYSIWSWFGPFQGSAATHGFEITLGSPAHLVLMAIAFLIGSRHRQIFGR